LKPQPLHGNRKRERRLGKHKLLLQLDCFARHNVNDFILRVKSNSGHALTFGTGQPSGDEGVNTVCIGTPLKASLPELFALIDLGVMLAPVIVNQVTKADTAALASTLLTIRI
jgi:hypothetical protein